MCCVHLFVWSKREHRSPGTKRHLVRVPVRVKLMAVVAATRGPAEQPGVAILSHPTAVPTRRNAVLHSTGAAREPVRLSMADACVTQGGACA